MELSPIGRQMIEGFEGLRLHAYPDPATNGEPYTIGYGHTGKVKPDDTCTQEQAEAWLEADVAWSVAAVNHLVTVPLEQHQFDALVSACFNLGQGAIGGSTLLRLLNAGDYNGAQAQFARWDKGPSGQPLPGLTSRRHAEAALFGSA